MTREFFGLSASPEANKIYVDVKKFKCSLFTHRAFKSSLGTRSTVTAQYRSNWKLQRLVFVKGGKPECPEKNAWRRKENRQHTQPTNGVTLGIKPGPHSTTTSRFQNKNKQMHERNSYRKQEGQMTE